MKLPNRRENSLQSWKDLAKFRDPDYDTDVDIEPQLHAAFWSYSVGNYASSVEALLNTDGYKIDDSYWQSTLEWVKSLEKGMNQYVFRERFNRDFA